MNFVVLVTFFLAWIINGKPNLADIRSFIGIGQYVVAVFCISILYNNIHVNIPKCMFKMISCVTIINILFSVIELFFYNHGVALITLLYTSDSQTSIIGLPGRFTRAYGANYSPVVLGVFAFVAFSYMLGYMIFTQNKLSHYKIITFFACICIGLIAFSKIVIIGIPILLLLSGLIIVTNRKNKFKKLFLKLAKGTMISSLSYLFIIFFASSIGLSGYVKWYFVDNFNIESALSTRYNNITVTESDSVGNTSNNFEDIDVLKEKDENFNNSNDTKDGNLVGAFSLFLDHPIIGVGPGMVNGEFLGDSELINILHNGGVIAFLSYAIFFGGIFILFLIRKEYTKSLILLAIGICCVAIPVFSIPCSYPFMAYCISNNQNCEV